MASRTSTLLAGTAGFVFIIATQQGMAQEAAGSATIDVSATIEEDCLLVVPEAMVFAFGVYEDQELIKTATFGWSCPSGKELSFLITGGQSNGTEFVLPNTTSVDPSSPLSYTIAVDGNGLVTNGIPFNINTTGGDETKDLTATMQGGQLTANHLPGDYTEVLTLAMTVN